MLCVVVCVSVCVCVCVCVCVVCERMCVCVCICAYHIYNIYGMHQKECFAALFDKKSCHTFMKIMPHFYGLCGNRRNTELRSFLPNTPQFGERIAFSWQKALQSKMVHCGAAIKVWRFCHQSAVLLVGEKWHECRHVFKCCCSAFVAFFLTRTVRTYLYPIQHIVAFDSAKRRKNSVKTQFFVCKNN